MDTVHRFLGMGESNRMLPIGDDDIDCRLVPFVTYVLIFFNVLFFRWI